MLWKAEKKQSLRDVFGPCDVVGIHDARVGCQRELVGAEGSLECVRVKEKLGDNWRWHLLGAWSWRKWEWEINGPRIKGRSLKMEGIWTHLVMKERELVERRSWKSSWEELPCGTRSWQACRRTWGPLTGRSQASCKKVGDLPSKLSGKRYECIWMPVGEKKEIGKYLGERDY